MLARKEELAIIGNHWDENYLEKDTSFSSK